MTHIFNEYNSYIHQLTDEYKKFIFLLLSILAVSSDGKRPKHAQYNISPDGTDEYIETDE
jgi:hypothetical protein